MTNGERVITAYFIIAYLVPMVGNLLFPDKIETIYQISPLSFYSVVLLVATYVLFIVASRSKSTWRPPVRLQRLALRIARLYRRLRLTIAIVSVPLSWQYFVRGMNSYRYAAEGEGISDLGSLLLLVVNVINVLATVDLMHAMLSKPAEVRNWRTDLGSVLFGFALVLSANGTASMFQTLFFLLYATFPRLSYALLFVRRGQYQLIALIKSGLSVALLVLLVLAAWIVGEGIKVSSSRRVSSVDAVTDVANETIRQAGFWSDYPYYFLSTNSIYYYSLLFVAQSERGELNYEGVAPVVLPLKTFLFRLDYILGRPLEILRPEPGTVSRVNYLLLTALPSPLQNPRAGSSPGLVAAFVYAFPFPISIVAAAWYLFVVARILDRFIAPLDRLSLFGVFLAVSCLHGIFQSPFDMLVVFDPSTLFTLLVIGAALTNVNMEKAAAGSLAPPRRLWSESATSPLSAPRVPATLAR